MNVYCPVCGLQLDFEPWVENSGSQEICPSCGIQFGYDDFAGGDRSKRADVYRGWRKKWLQTGPKWWSKSPQPLNWNPTEQIKNIPKEYL